MASCTRPTFSSERGSALLAVLAVAMLLSFFLAVGMARKGYLLNAVRVSARSTLTLSLAKSAVNTFIIALQRNEDLYYRSLNGCDTANGFIRAMAYGSGCAGASVTLFSGATSDPYVAPDTYQYPSGASGCVISPNASSCASYANDLIQMGVASPASALAGYSARFQIVKVLAASRMLEVRVTLSNPTQGSGGRFVFAIRDNFQNLVHLEADGRVTQERPDPLSMCPNNAWGTYQVFDLNSQSCKPFTELGGGTGLLAYKNRYFGFRPNDGMIIDLLSLTAGGSPSSYVVRPDGTVSGLGQIFVPYPDPANTGTNLANIDDLTMIEDQIYYVDGQGPQAMIGAVYASGGGWVFQKICDLGAAGWSQSYVGIATQSWSVPLIRKPGDPLSDAMTRRYATFFLKTDAGDLLTAYVSSTNPTSFRCTVFKDNSIQQDEYKRTNGFETMMPEQLSFIY